MYMIFPRHKFIFRNIIRNTLKLSMMNKSENLHEITEGSAVIKTRGDVFYNPVQEFNRDLSITVISAFAKQFYTEKLAKKPNLQVEGNDSWQAGTKCDNGLYILEALSATGLRSIRYAKEIPGVREIIANDLQLKAVEDIENNIKNNKVEHLVTPSHNDAVMLMYQHKQNQFNVIDLDPYGCPSIFLDSAIQAISDGGLLLVTATDMAVLAGNSPETCYTKYGAISLRIKSCHEMALRILLQCIESHANRYGKYIEPLLSLSVDFYIRVFVRVHSGQYKCKFSTSKLSHVYQCTGCDSFTLQPLGITKANEKNSNLVKFKIPTGPFVDRKCQHCGHPHHMGGPIWSAPLHSPDFVRQVLQMDMDKLKTFRRMQGILNVISEELIDVPLYYTLEKLCGTVHLETPQMLTIRSAILNAGYRVSFSHMNKTSIKTDAPTTVIWDIMRCWEKSHPVSRKRLMEGTPVAEILSKQVEKEHSFEMHPEANPPSRKSGFVRFQENPLPCWGPGFRNTAMIGDQANPKSKRNQGKRKRDESNESSKEIETK